MKKQTLIEEINNLVDKDVTIELPRPFVPDKAGDQETITQVLKDEDGNLQVATWNEDNGGNRKDVYNETYPLNGDLLTKSDLKEILSQIKEFINS